MTNILSKSLGLTVAVIALLFLFTQAVQAESAEDFYLADDEITIDGVIEDAWGDPIIEDEGGSGTVYCWVSGDTWNVVSSKDECTTYSVDYAASMNIEEAYFGVNETNMLLAFTNSWAMFAFYDHTNETYKSFYDYSVWKDSGMTGLPEPFSGKMVFSFDQDPVTTVTGELQEDFDWYVAVTLEFDAEDMMDKEYEPYGEEEEGGATLEIVQEEGTYPGYDSLDTVVSTLNDEDSELSSEEAQEPSETEEIKQNIENFYEVTGISSDEQVGFRLESYVDSGVSVQYATTTSDVTDSVLVTFTDDGTISEDSIVVGAGAKNKKKRFPSKYADGTVKVYSEDDQTLLKTIEAYKKKWGVQVAVGDVTGDGEPNIVTLPFKKMSKPSCRRC